MAYCTLAQVKAMLGDLGTDQDAAINAIIPRADSIIDLVTNRTFGLSGSTAKTFEGNLSNVLYVRDLVTATQIRVRDDTLATSAYRVVPAGDYEIGPTRDAALVPGSYVMLRSALTGSDTAWPGGPGTVEITGTWGWPAVPKAIEAASVDLTISLWRKRGQGDSDLGIPDLSQPLTRALPPMTYGILRRYIYPHFA